MGNPNAERSPAPAAPGWPPNSHGPWSVGLCDCFSDCGRFCISCWCPCITFGQVAEIIDNGSSSCCVMGGMYALVTFVTGFGFLCSCIYRSKMRQQYMLEGDGCSDCLKHCCCEACALTQMYREIQIKGNAEGQTRGVAMSQMAPPGMGGGMKR